MAESQDPSPAVNRREALSTIAFWCASAGAVGAVGLPAARFAVGNSMEEGSHQWVTVGPVDKLSGDDFKRVVYQFRAKDAWREVTKEGLLYARMSDGGQPLVVAATCTHLGCNVSWQKDESRFACPCHAGFYDPDGQVISGPPPRPLRRLETRLKDGLLEALV
ncbi:MAG: ubiquinol-cytochrome c reductase iron-sulfur subunit [Vicinamibacterales bacterium]